ncbi:MAG TPA: hypothetical protein VEP90_21945 [Methylomirabilota bacterium]|nr:hypothetical protein [Methylomirabilota bacterium]
MFSVELKQPIGLMYPRNLSNPPDWYLFLLLTNNTSATANNNVKVSIHQTFQPPSNSICKSIRYLDKDCINKFTTEKRRTDVLVNDADIISIDF